MQIQLARLLAARLCHDLGGVVGTLAGTLDLAEEREMLDLARGTAETLRQRLRLLAAAWGTAAEAADAATLGRLLDAPPRRGPRAIPAGRPGAGWPAAAGAGAHRPERRPPCRGGPAERRAGAARRLGRGRAAGPAGGQGCRLAAGPGRVARGLRS